MFEEILDYFKNTKEVITLKKMANDLKVEESALQKMLDFLVRKKKLLYSTQSTNTQGEKCRSCMLCSRKEKDQIFYYYLPEENK